MSSYLHVDNLVSLSLMDAGRRHKMPGPETKDGLILRAIAEARVSGLAPVLQDPHLTGQCDVGPVMPYVGNEPPYERGAPSLGNPELL